MNRRAAGCLLVGVGGFLAITLFGLSLALNQPAGCPARLQWSERIYEPIGSPAPSPSFAGGGQPIELGSTFIGLDTRRVYGPPGSSPSASAADRPDEIALDCADGTFQAYRYTRDLATPSP